VPTTRIIRRHRHRRKSRTGRWLALAVLALVLLWWLPPLPGPRFLEVWPAPDSGFTPWKPLFDGIDYAQAEFTKPRLMKCHVIRIDLANTNVSFLAKPSNGDRPGEADSQYPSSFVRHSDVQVAINTTPFSPDRVLPGRPVELQGLAVSQGDRFSPPEHNLDALVITRENRARFAPAGGDASDAWNGAGGFLVTMRGGTNVGEKLHPEPATVIGLSGDGRWMFWLVVDGRQRGYSEGATPVDTAEMLKSLGATDALNMDGGGSSTLAMQGGWKGAQVLNRPYHWVWNGLERPVGAVLGVRSKPLH
jgi:Phosphodiester glycosidase